MIRPQYTFEVFDQSITQITDERVDELLKRITPLILKQGRIYDFEIESPRDAYTMEPKGLVDVPDERNYFEVTRTATQHSCGYHAFFKPSIAEVLAQLPNDPDITAFYLDTATVVVLDQGRGHLCTAHWLTDKPRPRRRMT